MFDSNQRSTGTQYTTTVALLLLALIFTPVFLLLSRPVGYFAIAVAMACSAVCLAGARVMWTRYSDLTIPSIAGTRRRSK